MPRRSNFVEKNIVSNVISQKLESYRTVTWVSNDWALESLSLINLKLILTLLKIAYSRHLYVDFFIKLQIFEIPDLFFLI